MGLLTWLKREIDMLPSSRRRFSAPRLSLKQNAALSRSESYVQALKKFTDWRQMNATSQIRSESVERVSRTEVPEENLDNSQLLYEDIDVNNIKTAHFFQELKNMSLIEFTNCNIEYQLKSKYSYSHNKHISIDSVDHYEDYDESIYSLPFFNYCDESHNTTMLQNYLEENFQFLDHTDDEHEVVESKTNLVITDLDKSQDSNITPKTACNNIDKSCDSLIIADPQIFSELLFYPLAEIKVHEHEIEFNISNGEMRRGEVDSIEISFLQTRKYSRDTINNNFEALRKLRHPNIVLLMGISLDANSELESLILEPLSSLLYDHIYFKKHCIPVKSCLQYSFELIDAVTYLHARKYIHTSICSKNIMLSQCSGTLKLGGFELNIPFYEQFYENDSKPNNSYNKYLPLQLEFRKQHSEYFYQAPELLSGTSGCITATYQSDVYGICITLWEMLNCVIPYHQFTYSGLIKLFSLKAAQLPVYKEQRFLPFKAFLEEGLAIQIESRTKSATDLKNKLKHVNLSSYLSCRHEPNTKSDSDLPRERTSTIKKRINVSKWNHTNEPCSPITCANIFNPNTDCSIKVPDKVFYSKDNSCPQHHSAIPLKKKYKINIIIQSKCSSKSTQANSHTQESANASEEDRNECSKSNNVKQKIDIFESFLTTSSTSNRFYNSVELDVEPENSYEKKNGKDEYKNLDGMLNLKTENISAPKQFHPIATEDYYIDDDFPNDCNLGANIELNYMP